MAAAENTEDTPNPMEFTVSPNYLRRFSDMDLLGLASRTKPEQKIPNYKIAIISGDGIGVDVTDAAMKVIVAIWSAAQMLDHLGQAEASAAVLDSIEATTGRGIGIRPGLNTTDEITAAVLAALGA